MSRKTLNQVFARTVADAPEAVAVLDGARTLNYAELDAWSTAIAARLVAAGVGRGARVGLTVDRGVMAVSASSGSSGRAPATCPSIRTIRRSAFAFSARTPLRRW